MAKRVFFSFHYKDVIDFRANVVRSHRLTKNNQAGYFDASIWEEAKKTSTLALKRLINKELLNTSVTCVLIGTKTYERPWVRYEVFRSIYKRNKILGIHINKIRGSNKKIKNLGKNIFDYVGVKFNADASKYAFTEYKNGKWYYYDKIEGTRFFKNDYFAKNNPGEHLRLSKYFNTYDWISDDGYNNFSDWIE